MDVKTYIIPFVGLFGIFLGWILNQWNSVVAIQRENKGNLKLVLFNLLEVHYILVNTDEQEFVKNIKEHVFDKHFPKEMQTFFSNEVILKLYGEFIKNHLFPRLYKRLPKIKESYEKDLDTIKKVDPILAFRLSGRTDILDYLNNFSELLEPLEENDNDKQTSKKIASSLTPNLRKNMIETFEENIIDVAYQINFITWIRVKRRLSRKKENNFDSEEFEEMFSGLMRSIEPPNNTNTRIP